MENICQDKNEETSFVSLNKDDDMIYDNDKILKFSLFHFSLHGYIEKWKNDTKLKFFYTFELEERENQKLLKFYLTVGLKTKESVGFFLLFFFFSNYIFCFLFS